MEWLCGSCFPAQTQTGAMPTQAALLVLLILLLLILLAVKTLQYQQKQHQYQLLSLFSL
jgi:uncharacterized membrane protein YjgN (DUF898 family)